MYVSYLLDKEVPMYSSSVRHPGGLNLAAQNFVSAPQYPDYGGYHVAAAGVNLDSAQSPGPSWPSPYGAPLRDDWNGYGQGGPLVSNAKTGRTHVGGDRAGLITPPPPHTHTHRHTHTRAHTQSARPGDESACRHLLSSVRGFPIVSGISEQCSGGKGQNKALITWRSSPSPVPDFSSLVKTRTKDKYRVVYTDHQRLELEKEFHYSRYITIRRKAELAATLGLSERQVKIWFQNRRAKERKINKKKLQQSQPGSVHSGSQPLSPVSSLQGSTGPGPAGGVLGAAGVLAPSVTQ
uniref:Caudal type homeobox 2 n=1 Tax=Pelodiscus sinensis TaxID=13735 RepID=K7G0A7_PELSI